MLNFLKHEWMETGFAVLIFVYTRRKKAWINIPNFLTIKKFELDFTNLVNHGKNNQHWIGCIIWSVWPNGWVFVYELSGCGFESSCSHWIGYWSLGRRKGLMGCQHFNLQNL